MTRPTARDTVERALDLWYGEPLDGVPGPAAEATRTRLRALRLSLHVTRAELDLELGHFEQAATDLDDLLRAHPKHEGFRLLHILALKNQGRIAEAIESYETYEEFQDRQYSEPNPTMLELHRELRAAAADTARAPSPWNSPAPATAGRPRAPSPAPGPGCSRSAV